VIKEEAAKSADRNV